ncbi:unnamed protein product [Effrenium voratum]|uniref:Uncharacterized protein n=1 Tax=Effrenium voratum TaxID=2562239 RepID=A0AA36I6B2_9DINO|nr:unnamed protein product [Effrenium voratum]CAJ1441638.1 unnamed protein product [Effrenium voratum]
MTLLQKACSKKSHEAEGPIAIKFAQWASTRPDLLPRSVCDHLSPLQASVKPHNFRQTKRILTDTFGPTWESSLQLAPSSEENQQRGS